MVDKSFILSDSLTDNISNLANTRFLTFIFQNSIQFIYRVIIKGILGILYYLFIRYIIKTDNRRESDTYNIVVGR